MIRVCVIGAGAAGLCACRNLSADTSKFLPTLYEQTDVVGGTWVYNESVGLDVNGLPIHSSMYKNLRTNLPKEVMAYPDFPFRESKHSFLHHTDVRKYLEDYCKHFNLSEFIHFETRVTHVTPETVDDRQVWKVTHENLKSKISSTKFFDAVIVCNGHYSVPKVPEISGISFFTGIKMHSHDYRSPERFSGRRVVVLGAAASGVDIGLEISTVAKKVFLSHNGPLIQSELPDNTSQISGITSFKPPSTFVNSDGVEVEADAILFCTGYNFDFPFLDSSCKIIIDSQKVMPLYKHLIHIEYPTMAFIGIPFQICPFPMFDLQVKFFLKSLSGEVTLPPKADMWRDTEQEMKAKEASGIAPRHFHKMGKQQWNYNRELATMAAVEEIPRRVETLYDEVHDRRKLNLMNYKEDAYALDGEKFVRLDKDRC